MIKTFTHSDLDGAGVNYVAQALYSKDQVDTTLTNYDKIDQQLVDFIKNKEYKNYDQVIIGDIAPENEETYILLDEAHKAGAKLHLIDDETSTEASAKKYDWVNTVSKVTTFKSAASYETLMVLLRDPAFGVKKEIATADRVQNLWRLCDLIRKYDTWEWKNHPDQDSEKASKLDQLYWIIGYERFQTMLEQQNYSPKIADAYQLLLEIDNEKKEHYFKKHEKYAKFYPNMFKINGHHYNVILDFAEDYISELGNKLLTDNPQADTAMVVNADKETISYRSTGKANVKDLATHFGGGGSEQTSGSPLPFDLKAMLQSAYVQNQEEETSNSLEK